MISARTFVNGDCECCGNHFELHFQHASARPRLKLSRHDRFGKRHAGFCPEWSSNRPVCSIGLLITRLHPILTLAAPITGAPCGTLFWGANGAGSAAAVARGGIPGTRYIRILDPQHFLHFRSCKWRACCLRIGRARETTRRAASCSAQTRRWHLQTERAPVRLKRAPELHQTKYGICRHLTCCHSILGVEAVLQHVGLPSASQVLLCRVLHRNACTRV